MYTNQSENWWALSWLIDEKEKDFKYYKIIIYTFNVILFNDICFKNKFDF
jgi:hypothetical protein